MEEDKIIKRKRTIRMISKIISYTFIVLLMLIASFLIFFVITSKIAQKKGDYPPYGLYTIISPSMTPKLNVYDVIFIKNVDTDTLKVGDIITFYSHNKVVGNTPITHRIIEISNTQDEEKKFKVKGDYNKLPDEEKVDPKDVLGKVIFKIPSLGKLQYFLASRKGWLFAIIVPTIIIIAYDIYKILRLIMLRNKLQELAEEDDTILPNVNDETIASVNETSTEIIQIEDEIVNNNVNEKTE